MTLPPALADVVHLLPLSTRTDLDVLCALGRPEVTVHDDHLVVRSHDQPEFHWGNCIQVFDQPGWDNPSRWVEDFRAEFPQASWVAISLPHAPADPASYTELGLSLEACESLVLTSSDEVKSPHTAPLPPGYMVRELTPSDLDAVAEFDLEINEGSQRYERESHLRFLRSLWGARLGSHDAVFVGAYAENSSTLVSHLGVVESSGRARYQTVLTHPEHRRRGLTSHLLGVAGQWATHRGATEFVIVTQVSNPAGRVYRRAGFVPSTSGATQAYSYTRG